MRQRILAMSTSSRNEIALATFESQYLVGAASPCGHSIRNVSSGRAAAPFIGAVRTQSSSCMRAALLKRCFGSRPLFNEEEIPPAIELAYLSGPHLGYWQEDLLP